MKTLRAAQAAALNRRLAIMLSIGTWAATVMIGLALAGPLLGMPVDTGRAGLATIGIGAMICLPVARVFFLAVTFYRERDLPYAAIAVLVLCIIALSLWLGARS